MYLKRMLVNSFAIPADVHVSNLFVAFVYLNVNIGDVCLYALLFLPTYFKINIFN